MSHKIETEMEDDGRWIADVPSIPGVMVYGTTRDEAITKARSLLEIVLSKREEESQ